MAFVDIWTLTSALPTDAQYLDITEGDRVVAHAARRRHNEPGFGEWKLTVYDALMQGKDAGWTSHPTARARSRLGYKAYPQV